MLMASNILGNQVIDMAIQIKQKGYDFYSLLQTKTKKKNFQKTLNWLANEEKKHIQMIEGMRSDFYNLQKKTDFNWSTTENYFQGLLDINFQTVTDDIKQLTDDYTNELSAIQIAISIEKENILYLQKLKNLLKPGEQEKINELIQKLTNFKPNNIKESLDLRSPILRQFWDQ